MRCHCMKTVDFFWIQGETILSGKYILWTQGIRKTLVVPGSYRAGVTRVTWVRPDSNLILADSSARPLQMQVNHDISDLGSKLSCD